MFTQFYYLTEALIRGFSYLYGLLRKAPPPKPPVPEAAPGPYALVSTPTGTELVAFRPGTKVPRLQVPIIDGIGQRHWQEVRPQAATAFRVYLTSQEVAEMPSERWFETIERLAEKARKSAAR